MYTVRGLHSPRESLANVLACLRMRGRFFLSRGFVRPPYRFRNARSAFARLLLPLRTYNLSHCELHTENSFVRFAVEEVRHADFSSMLRGSVSPERIFR